MIQYDNETTLNDIQKLYALMVSDKVRIWHYAQAADVKKYWYWLVTPDGVDKGHAFDNLTDMITEAYIRIDPLLQPLVKPIQLP